MEGKELFIIRFRKRFGSDVCYPHGPQPRNAISAHEKAAPVSQDGKMT